jgi:type I restriction enzyme S subunit
MNIEAVKSALISLAIRGKLVPQRDNEPAVKQIGEAPEEAPFEIPAKWKWCELQALGKFISGWTPKPAELNTSVGLPYFRVADMNTIGNEHFLSITDKFYNGNKKFFLKNTIVYPKNGGAIFTNKKRILKQNSVVDLNTGGFLPDALMDLDFAFLLFTWIDFKKISKGTALPTIDQKKLRSYAVPLPPLAEQRRIVAKLEELLEPLSRVQERLGSLTHDFPEQFKAAVLQKAIQGKLVPQRDDEAAVEQIGEAPEEAPFEIPAKWKWVTLSEAGELIRGITFPANKKSKNFIEGTVRCLTTGSVQVFYKESSDVFVSKDFIKNRRQVLKKGDIVISSANSRELVGKSLFWNRNDSQTTITFGGFLTVMRVFPEIPLDSHYLFVVIKQLFLNKFFQSVATQTTNIANLSNKKLSPILIPLPPLAEQRRIVAKVEQLFSQVDELTARLSS